MRVLVEDVLRVHQDLQLRCQLRCGQQLVRCERVFGFGRHLILMDCELVFGLEQLIDYEQVLNLER